MDEAAVRSLDGLRARDPWLVSNRDQDLGVVRHLRGQLAGARKGESLRSTGRRFVKAHPELFGEIDFRRAKAVAEVTDPRGGRGVTLLQHHGAHPVQGGSVRFHADSEGTLDSISSRLFPDLAGVPTEPGVELESAVRAARRKTRCRRGDELSAGLVVVRHDGAPRLVWEVRLFEEEPGDRGLPAEWIVLVDATSGRVLSHYDNVHNATIAQGTGYYSRQGELRVEKTSPGYQLVDDTLLHFPPPVGPYITTFDGQGMASVTASLSADPDGNWKDKTLNPRSAHQGPEVDTHRFALAVATYFLSLFRLAGFDELNPNFQAIVHYGRELEESGFIPEKKLVVLGDGSMAAPGVNYLSCWDVVAHEFTHGYVASHPALVFEGESGSLNDAIADCFAAFITQDWLFGKECWRRPGAPAIRNMIDPSNNRQYKASDPVGSALSGHQPSHYSEAYKGTSDKGGVHVNSGIIDNLMYLLSVGGTNTVSNIKVDGIGPSVVEIMLGWCMLVELVGLPRATFLDFRQAMLDTLYFYYPQDVKKLTQVKRAFNAVGIGPDLVIRDSTLDDGSEPGAVLFESPDIINQQTYFGDPTPLANLAGGILSQNIKAGQKNYVYVRFQNFGADVPEASVTVYLTPPTTFATPAQWKRVGAVAVGPVKRGRVTVASPVMIPPTMIPAPGRYCLIAVVSTSLDPAPQVGFINSAAQFTEFVAGSNNIAFKHLDVIAPVTDDVVSLEAVVDTLGGPERYEVRLELTRVKPERILVRGPGWALNGAFAKGMKLIAREGEDNVYEVLQGEPLERHRAFLGLGDGDRDALPGFDDLLVERGFTLRVECAMPKRGGIPKSRKARPERPQMALSQSWRGQPVGRVGLYLDGEQP